jgi:hypothetical protein
MYKVYISASTQKENVGVSNYGNEQDRMMFLSDRIKYFLELQDFTVFRNQPNWTLMQTIDDSNSKYCDLFIDNHTNADKPNSQGTEVFYHGNSVNGKRIATKVYEQIAPLSPGIDRGVKSDSLLYTNGLAVLRETNPPACLVEHIFHTNETEVKHFINNIDLYAIAEAKAICNYFNIKWTEPKSETRLLVEAMYNKGLITITNVQHWVDALDNKTPINLNFLKIVFKNTIDKIKP